MNNTLEQRIRLFREKFVKERSMQVDAGNSIVVYDWRNSHSHLPKDIEQFLIESMEQVRTETLEELIKYTRWNKGDDVAHEVTVNVENYLSNLKELKPNE